MAEAFTLELNGKHEKTTQYIRQAKILQYCSELGNGQYFDKFFERMLGPDPRARAVFEDDVAKTVKHIEQRCIALRKEQEEREAKRKALLDEHDPNEPIEVKVPETASDEERARVAAFQSFSAPFQHALLSGDLEKVNDVLQTMDPEEAERVLQQCNETGLLSIEESPDDAEEDDDKEAQEPAS
ncbi:hypothetical protein SYNPS1DRAFT_26100 [Syncephalis pseudoplumigaleata]|uniref:Hsp90 chaperone protein kinase-targeting subunit n=1 Tax=Syncephalis pseudoplumigaleata TaxID=1712513 RepID=A0A4P9YR01_9FUNG|nr:hypothetical protein SYNPS1DRAFT_26100 [Syncephalis pseudoplumigaleata]|eukprot:RKP22237.1 hypothetical protein SYNPS1DRAFT_26100 [Syncephalis pseudoplumigaleata]